jgi:Lon protease-like protein
MLQNDTWVPLFPLKAVLFPGGILPLKVFETRYIDMVRECMKREAPFGVVLIKSGQEVGAPADPEAVGCFAHISQWDMPNLGVMMLRTEGGKRFRILETRVLADNRLEARVETIEADKEIPVSTMHVDCAKTLKIVIDDLETRGEAEPGAGFDSPFARPIRLDSAGWVATRWCEILPIPLKARQKLMELDDPRSRLTIVHRYLQQHQII